MNNQARKSRRHQPLDRRSFLKLLASGALASLVPPQLASAQSEGASWPNLPVSLLPISVREILKLTPPSRIGENGLLTLVDQEGGVGSNVPLVPTNWNIENSHNYNQLTAGQDWGIVLHWFGDHEDGQQNLDFYLRGFNGVRQIGEYITSTSAHFLVGNHPPRENRPELLGIAQTQAPAPDGTPYQAAHIRTLDYGAQAEGRQYFVLAMHKLSRAFPGVRSILQDFYALPGIPAHMQTLAIEITGTDFDNPARYPGPQKIANVLSVARACMQRYRIPAINLMGHFELQLSKPDPGKKFLAMIKYLIAVMALVEPDQDLKELVFGSFLGAAGSRHAAVKAYFHYLREYILLTTSPQQIYEWDAWSKFLIFSETLATGTPWQDGCQAYYPPLKEPTWKQGFNYLTPVNHDGIDIYPAPQTATGNHQERGVHLLTTGTCIYLGKSSGLHSGYLAVFRHRQAKGSEFITSYGHLDAFVDLQLGAEYPGGRLIGKINTPISAPHGFLHFSVAYGPAWETSLHLNPNTPLNAGSTWIRNHFMDPAGFLPVLGPAQVGALKNTHIRPK